MSKQPLSIAFFGSSLVSAYWNGAATYYRGILRALHRLGYRITFYEPIAFDRQKHRDIDDPEYASVVTYPATLSSVRQVLARAQGADVIVKASGVGVFDNFLEEEVLGFRGDGSTVIFWDVDAPATLHSARHDPHDHFAALIPEYDFILTYGGGPPVIEAYGELGARRCVPIYNAHDPDIHHPVEPEPRFQADLAFCGNRMPDREQRVHEFFFNPAFQRPDRSFLLAGSGWEQHVPDLPNVRRHGHLYTRDHNAFNASPLAMLNISRRDMAEMGYSPATRLFEVGGANGCLITDSWQGIEQFLTPGEECLVASDTSEVVALLDELTPDRAREIGHAAGERLRREHTYAHRAERVDSLLRNARNGSTPEERPAGGGRGSTEFGSPPGGSGRAAAAEGGIG